MSFRRMASCSGASIPILTRRPGSAEQRDLNRAIGKQLSHGHIGVSAVRGLYDDRFIGSAAEY